MKFAFFWKVWKKYHYYNILCRKTVLPSCGGGSFQYAPDEQHHITVTSPVHLQGDHEEADTLIAFQVTNITTGNVMVRASDADVLVILIGTLGQ